MSEFLKQYHLFGDMSRLNNQAYFSQTFQVPDIAQFFSALKESSDLKLNAKTLKIYLLNLCRGRQKSVYVQLKWLLCLHRTLQHIKNALLLERIYDFLSKMELPQTTSKIDEFILEGIIHPYIHFLAKLCLIRMQEIDSSNPSEAFDKQNRQTSNHNHSLIFIKYNLIKHSIAQLLPTTVELQGFFKIYYPVLAKIPILLHRSLANLIQSIRGQQKGLSLSVIRQEQLFIIQGQIQQLDKSHSSDASYFEVESTQIGSMITYFMESGIRQIKVDNFQSHQEYLRAHTL